MMRNVMNKNNEITYNIKSLKSNLRLNIIGYNKFMYVVILIIRFSIVARGSIHASLSVDERVHAESRVFPSSRRLLLGVILLLVITVVNLEVWTARWPHWSFRFLFI